MNHKRSVALAAIAVALAIAMLRSPAERAPDVASGERPPEPKVEATYPPALPSYSEPLPAPPPASAPASTNATELCGYGKVDPEQVPAVFEAVADSALLRVVDEFERARDPRKHALSLATKAWIDAEAADRRVMAEDPQTCRETALCDEQAAEAFARAATPSIEALARLAINTQDPQVYVMAMRACRSIIPDSPPSACGALTLDQWTQLDPDNAMVWLLNARAARMRKDTPGFDDALQRAARARFFDRRRTPYGEILASVDERSQPVRTLIVGRLAAADARDDPGEYFSHFTVVGHHCAKQGEPGRRELCNELAQVLLERSSDGLALEVGVGLASSAGWAADRVAEARKRQTGPEASGPRTNPENPLSCRGAKQIEERLIAMARGG
jgi:hypothetical protein